MWNALKCLCNKSQSIRVVVNLLIKRIKKLIPFSDITTGVCFGCLRFLLRLSLSVNDRMTCVWPNCYSAITPFFIENGNLAGHFKVINIYIIECEWPNSNLNDLCIDRIAIQSFTLKLKRKRKLRDTECTNRMHKCLRLNMQVLIATMLAMSKQNFWLRYVNGILIFFEILPWCLCLGKCLPILIYQGCLPHWLVSHTSLMFLKKMRSELQYGNQNELISRNSHLAI